jgi:hypothetical protein
MTAQAIAHQPVDHGRLGGITREIPDKFRQHRNDDAEGSMSSRTVMRMNRTARRGVRQ